MQLVHRLTGNSMPGSSWKLAKGEQNLAEEYRLVRKDGTVIWVRDTVSMRKLQDGTLDGDSVLTDISDLKRGKQRPAVPGNETIPCGFMKNTPVENSPR